MKICGIIAEYNPFHNGHEYHIAKARELCDADFVIVVMSGNFVQRGIPAICDKFIRAEAALRGGADLVLELPTCYSTAAADDFARAGIMLLDKLGVIDTVCFGSESGDIDLITECAHNMQSLQKGPGSDLKDCLRRGLSYPAAMQVLGGISLQSNDMLGAAYVSALTELESRIRPVAIKRIGSSYLDEGSDADSATAIRRRLSEGLDCTELVPEYAVNTISGMNVFADDLSGLLYMKLLSEIKSAGLTCFADVSKTIEGTIIKRFGEYTNISQFVNLIASKNYTKGRIMRALTHILLDITDEDIGLYKDNGMIGYARILGMRRSCAAMLTAVKGNSEIPIIAKAADAGNMLKAPFDRQFKCDVEASNLYDYVYSSKYHVERTHEYAKSIKCI